MVNTLKYNTTKWTLNKGTKDSAGYDLCCNLENTLRLWPGQTKVIPTGIRLEIPKGYFGLVTSRSSTYKRGLVLANSVGIIDSDYRGEVMIPVTNNGTLYEDVNDGDRLAQLLILPVANVQLDHVNVEDLSITGRGDGGFGSTGK